MYSTEKMNRNPKRRLFLEILLFIALIVIECVLLGIIADEKKNEKIQEAKYYGEDIANTIQLTLDSNLKASETLRYIYMQYGEDCFKDFEDIASKIAADNPAIGSMYIAPKAVIQVAYPKEVNESTIGFAMLEDPEQGPRAQLAIDTRKTTVAGPHNLIEGGVGFIIRDPVFDGDEFIGFTILVLDWDRIVENVLNNIKVPENSYKFAVWKNDHDETAVTDSDGYIFRSSENAVSNVIDIEFEVPNDTWHLIIEPVKGWAVWEEMLPPVVMSIILDIAVAFGLVFIRRINRKDDELKKELAANEAITAINDKLEKTQHELLEQLHLVNALSQDYLNVFVIDIENNSARVVKLDGYVTAGIREEKKEYPYDVISRQYIHDRVYTEDTEMMLEVMDAQNLREKLRDHAEYVGVYRVHDHHSVHYFQYKYVMVEGTSSIVAGFQNIDQMIASEKEQQERLQQALDVAEAANTAKSTFLFNMSHDIRTPMNAILGFSQLMEKELDHPAVAKNYLSKIQSSGEYLLSIINNVLDMARIESGKVTLDEQLMETLAPGRNAVQMIMPEIRKKNLRFTHSEDYVHQYVLADAAKINQVFVNLLSNAVKYTPEGGTIHLEVKEYPSEKDGYGRFVSIISDTGIGMSEEFQKVIFESFSREKNTTESKVVGTGLGMSIVKKLVDLMGGTIEVESQIGKGSTFRFICDFKLANNVTIASRSKENKKEDIEFTGKRILLAEDNDLNAQIAIAILEELDLHVERAEDGVQCIDMLNKAEAGYYDLILMDIQMPNLDGYGAAQTIRKMADPAKANIPILAMTANAFAEDKEKAVAAGMNGHLAKPINIPELMKALEEVLV